MNRKSIATSLFLSAIMVAFLTWGCRERLIPESPDYVEYGWDLMAEEDYQGAVEQFETGTENDATYADGWNGLGWAFARLGEPDSSLDNFTRGVNFADSVVVETEILAGRSFVRLALEQYPTAITDAKSALQLTSTWVFRRDVTITYEHLILTVATGYYSLGQFDSSLVWVRQLDNTFSVDVATLSGRSRLAAKLEALRDIL